MKRLLINIVLLCVVCGIYAQSTIYTYNGKCKIEIPNKLELQHSELHSVKHINAQNQKKQVQVSTKSGHITFQQLGLNAQTKTAQNQYCRVILEYFPASKQSPVYQRGERIIVDYDLITLIGEIAKDQCKQSKTSLLKFFNIEATTINGYPTIYYSFRRQGWEGRPPVIVNVFWIYNKYENVILTFSYRESERATWINIMDYLLKSFKFTKNY